MKLKNILLLSVFAAIICCLMTSCEKNEWCNITEVNTTTNWGVKIYFDGKVAHANMIIEPGDSGIDSFQENYDKPDLNNPIDIKIEWYKMTRDQTFNKTPVREFTRKGYKFEYDHKYKITVRDKDFTIQQVQ